MKHVHFVHIWVLPIEEIGTQFGMDIPTIYKLCDMTEHLLTVRLHTKSSVAKSM